MFTSVNQTPVAEFVNGGLSFGAFTAVDLTSSGVVNSGASSIPLGILTADTNIDNESVTVQLSGGALWLAGESIAAGDFLSAGLSGVAFKSTSGKFMFAQALENASAGGAARVQIVRAGKL